ncbi:hypothetical protein [Methylomonas sp. MgM2]
MNTAWFPSLKVAVNGARLSCVVDVALALAPGGFLFTLRLAEEANVFLGRELWFTLDSQELDSVDPARQAEFKLWKIARVDSHLNGLRIFWVGDSRQESLLPDYIDKQFLQRYEALAETLDNETGEAWLLSDSERSSLDTLALAGALMPYRPVIFSCDSQCSNLMDYIGKHMKLYPAPNQGSQFARSQLQHLFFRNGISELLWNGLKLNVIHLVAPFAMVMPAIEPNKQYYWQDAGDWEAERPIDAWEAAYAHWYTVDARVS